MIIVTGASRGLGRRLAERLLTAGNDVVGIARNVDGLPFEAYSADVAVDDEVRSIASEMRRSKRPLEALINAAGVASMNLAVMTPSSTVHKVIGTNLLGTIHSCQSFAPLMIRNGAGSIVNFSTIAVAIGLAGESAYVASKAGVEGYSRVLAKELAPHGIRVNCVAPGPIDTDLLKGVSAEQIAEIVRRQVIPKQFGPDDVCDVVDLLLDRRAASIAGQVLHIGGV